MRTVWRAALAAGVVLVVFQLARSDGGRDLNSLVLAQSLIFLMLAAAVGSGAQMGPPAKALLGMIGVVAVTAIWSVRPEASVRELLLWMMYAGIAALAAVSIRGAAAAWFVNGLVLVAGWLTLVALFMFWGNGNPSLRWYSTFYWPNPFAAFLLLVLPLSLVRALRAGRPRDAFVHAAVTVLLGVSLVFSYSRGAWLAAAAVVPLTVVLLRPRRWSRAGLRMLVMALCIIVAVAALTRMGSSGTAAAVVTRAASIADPTDPSLQGRRNFWRSAVLIFADHPWIGTGPGTFGAVHPSYQRDVRFYARDAHSLYLQIAAEMGLLGLLALAALLGSIAALWVRLLRRTGDAEEYSRVAGIGLGLLAFLLHSALDMDWSFPADPAMAFALAGVLAAASVAPHKRDRRRSRKFVPALRAAVVVVLIAAVLAAQFVRVANQRFAAGAEAARAGRWKDAAAAYAQASRWNPLSARYRSAQAAAMMAVVPPEPARGLEALQAAARLDRMNASYPFQMAHVILSDPAAGEAQFREAESLLQDALRLDRFNRPEIYRELAALYLRWGRTQEAGRVYGEIGARYLGRGLGGDSITYVLLWPEVVALSVEAADFYVQRADDAAAVALLRMVLEEDPGAAPAAVRLATLYLSHGRKAEARMVLDRAAARAPNNERIRALLETLR